MPRARLLRPAHLNHDLHTHTTLLRRRTHPIPLHVLEARAFELDAIAITDHYTPGGKICTSPRRNSTATWRKSSASGRPSRT